MATSAIHIDGMTGVYDSGLWLEVSFTNVVTGITDTDTKALQTAVTKVGALGTALGAGTVEGGDKLFLESVSPRIESTQDGTVAFVDVTYRRVDGDAEDPMPLSGGGTLSEITTELDKGGKPITVTDENGETQMGSISVLSPQRTISLSTIEAVQTPGDLVKEYNGSVNSENWNAGESGTWLASVTFDRYDLSATPRKWKFNWEFQYEPTGWNPQVFFINKKGRPPANLVEGKGWKTIEWYTAVDFGAKF